MLAAVTDEAPAGKGRPTPKRRDARKRRRNATPTNRKEAAALRRERLREQRSQQRHALQTGDERHLPPRDAGQAKKLARDYVDGRFTLGQVFFGMILVVFLLAFVPAAAGVANGIVLIAFVGVVIDSIRVGRGARRAVEEKYGAKEATGITQYAVLRSMQPRRLRRPPAPKQGRKDRPTP
jgi:Flp pilus assembly protein TadB